MQLGGGLYVPHGLLKYDHRVLCNLDWPFHPLPRYLEARFPMRPVRTGCVANANHLAYSPYFFLNLAIFLFLFIRPNFR